MSKEIETTLRVNRNKLIKFHQREIKSLQELIKLHKQKIKTLKKEQEIN